MGPNYKYWIFNQWHRDEDQNLTLLMLDKTNRLHEYFLLPGFLHKWIYLYNETPPCCLGYGIGFRMENYGNNELKI